MVKSYVKVLVRTSLLAISLTFLGSASWGAQPVLQTLKEGGKLLIGYRDASIPFSYINEKQQPVGYAVDLCLKVGDALAKVVGRKQLPVEFVLVTSANRISLVEAGKVHMECGSTTNNAERREKVAFAIPHFVTGARLLVKATSTIVRIEDLEGKTLVSTKGSTPLKVAQQVNKERLLQIKIVEAPDHAKGVWFGGEPPGRR